MQRRGRNSAAVQCVGGAEEVERDQSQETPRLNTLTMTKEAGLYLHEHPNTGTICTPINKYKLKDRFKGGSDQHSLES